MNKGTSKQTVIEIKGKDYSRKKKKQYKRKAYKDVTVTAVNFIISLAPQCSLQEVQKCF